MTGAHPIWPCLNLICVDRETKRAWKELDGLIENPAASMQLRRVRQPRKAAPPWAGTQAAIDAYLLRRAKHRAKVAYLYWCLGWTARDIAAETHESEAGIKQLVYRMKRE